MDLTLILTFGFGILMCVAGISHFTNFKMYLPFIPRFIPAATLIYGSGLVELVLGIGVFIPQYRSNSIFGILILMIVFLPLHIIDIFKEKPAIGSRKAAFIRLPIQFLLIFIAWYIYKK